MKSRPRLLNMLLLGAALALPPVVAAADQTVATSGAGGVYPAGTSFVGVNVTGLELGFGAELNTDGSGLGNFTAVLVGVSALGAEQRISVQGYVTGGSRNANVAVITGTSTVDLGDGTPPTPGVPFTATATSDPATGRGTVGLSVVTFANLPNATLNAGTLSIKNVPIE